MFSGSQFVITISRLGFETRLELVNAAITVHKPKGTQQNNHHTVGTIKKQQHTIHYVAET